MPNFTPNLPPSAAAARVDPRIARTLWQWLALGALAVALLPAARGDSLLVGALPFWLVAAPATGLLALYRHVLAAAWRARLVPATPRRRRRTGAVRCGRAFRPDAARPAARRAHGTARA